MACIVGFIGVAIGGVDGTVKFLPSDRFELDRIKPCINEPSTRRTSFLPRAPLSGRRRRGLTVSSFVAGVMKGTKERMPYADGLNCIGARWQSPFDLFKRLSQLGTPLRRLGIAPGSLARNMLLASRTSKPPVPAPADLRISTGLGGRARNRQFEPVGFLSSESQKALDNKILLYRKSIKRVPSQPIRVGAQCRMLEWLGIGVRVELAWS